MGGKNYCADAFPEFFRVPGPRGKSHQSALFRYMLMDFFRGLEGEGGRVECGSR